jgi:hypothetical protein
MLNLSFVQSQGRYWYIWKDQEVLCKDIRFILEFLNCFCIEKVWTGSIDP